MTDRLSALDAEFLHLDDGVAHLHIAGMSVFDGPPVQADELVALLESRLHLLPRYRQRVRPVPLELGRPIWADDPHFRLDYHVRQTGLPAPGDDMALCRLMGRLMSQPLDRRRPLWETWLVEGLPDSRWALVYKVHHCMVDGIAGVELLTATLDTEPAVELTPPQPWAPRPEPSAAAKTLGAWTGLAGDVASGAGQLPSLVAHPMGTLQRVGDTAAGVLRMGRHLAPTPRLSIEGTIGPHRTWAHCGVSLAAVKAIRRTFGGTINDVVLAAVSAGYRELLVRHGDDPDRAVVRSLVPVSVREGGDAGASGNRVSALLLELPVHLGSPLERLEAVRRQMTELKGSHMAEAGDTVSRAADLAPPMLLGTVSRLAMRAEHQVAQRSVNTVTTNVPGPQFPLYCLGREMVDYRPFVPITHGFRVGTAIISYNGRLAFGVTGDYDTTPDVDVVAEGIASDLGELDELASPGR